MRWLVDDFDYYFSRKEKAFGQKDVIDIIGEVGEAIGVGQPHSVPQTWCASIQQLHREQDFHITGSCIFKKCDPISDALDGNCGQDVIDADLEQKATFLDKIKDDPRVIQFYQKHPTEKLRQLMETDNWSAPDDAMSDVVTGLDADKIHSFFHLFDAKMTTDLDSPFSALGYQKPKDRYEYICRKENTMWADRAAERRHHFNDLRIEVSDCDDEGVLNKFLWRIRDDYYADKALRSHWNEKARLEDRAIYTDSLQKQGFTEEEIRRKLFFVFDCKKIKESNLYRVVNGRKIRVNVKQSFRNFMKNRKSQDSIWYKKRSDALSETTLTLAQWSEIYKIAKEKRIACRQFEQNKRTRSQETLHQLIKTIKTVTSQKDLNHLSKKLQHKQVKLHWEDRRSLWRVVNAKVSELSR